MNDCAEGEVADMAFDPGFDISPRVDPMGFTYGPGVFGPDPEFRNLNAIRASLHDPSCAGPDPVYAIAMDVGTKVQRTDLVERNLLYGAVAYAAGALGREPVRSQGHVHAVSPSCGTSTPELYEIWSGRAVILMQEFASDDPGRCFAVEAGIGDLVVVPPGWAHATISADRSQPLTFGAWCVRDYGFDYSAVRSHSGLAWFPRLGHEADIVWEPNPAYPVRRALDVHPARDYPDLGLKRGLAVYTQYLMNPETMMWVPQPGRRSWAGFVP